MNIPLLLSGLNELPSFSDPIKIIFDRNESIPEILNGNDVDVLLNLRAEIQLNSAALNLPFVDINVMTIHVNVIKPFISQSDDEDDFI